MFFNCNRKRSNSPEKCGGRGYFNIIYGRRLTYSAKGQYYNRIHIFGDSKIFSVYTTDNNTIPSILQKKIDTSDGVEYRVLNYGIPSFKMERILHQIESASFRKDDIIVIAGCINMQLCGNFLELWNSFIKIVTLFCESKGLSLILMHLPNIYELEEKTYIEKYILEIYN